MRKYAFPCAIGLWVNWTLLTWFLEGRIETLNRPDAVAARLVYTLIANVLVGIIGSILLLRGFLGAAAPGWATVGFGSLGRTAAWVPLGFI
jgi:hypothetical protein